MFTEVASSLVLFLIAVYGLYIFKEIVKGEDEDV